MPPSLTNVGFLDELEVEDGSGEGSGETVIIGWPEIINNSETTQILNATGDVDPDIILMRDVFSYVSLIIIALGTLANFTAVAVLLHNRLKIHSISTIFLILCLIDVLALWGYFIETLTVFIPELILNVWSCRVMYVLTRAFAMISSGMIVTMSIERLIYHKSPHMSSNVFTKLNILKILTIIAIVFTGLSSHGFWTFNIDISSNICIYWIEYMKFWLGWWIFECCMISLVPLPLLIIFTLKIFSLNNNEFCLNEDTVSGKLERSSPRKMNSNTKISIAIMISFFVLVTPSSIFELCKKHVSEDYSTTFDIFTKSTQQEDDTDAFVMKLITFIFFTMVLIFHSSKFLLFFIFGKTFRKVLFCNSASYDSDSDSEIESFQYLDIVKENCFENPINGFDNPIDVLSDEDGIKQKTQPYDKEVDSATCHSLDDVVIIDAYNTNCNNNTQSTSDMLAHAVTLLNDIHTDEQNISTDEHEQSLYIMSEQKDNISDVIVEENTNDENSTSIQNTDAPTMEETTDIDVPLTETEIIHDLELLQAADADH